MSERGLTQKTAAPALHSVPSGLLQRQCACGNHTIAGGECEACRKKRDGMLQRAPASAAPVNGVLPIVHNVLRLPGQLPDAATRAFREPRFGRDLSRIPTHSPAAGAIQTKLAINKPGDEYEQEADRIADQVMAAPAHSAVSGAPPRIQRFSGQSNGQMDAAPASVDQALTSPGRPLESALRQDMEERFKHDFNNVRVHVDDRAANSAAALGANAYTLGQHIVFGRGEFDPASGTGRRLIAHELAHTIQQRGTGNEPLGKAPAPEREADRAANQVRDSSAFPTLTPSGLVVACERAGEIPQSASDPAKRPKRICVPGLAADDPVCVEWAKRKEQLEQSEKKQVSVPFPLAIGLKVPAHPDAISGVHDWENLYGTPGRAIDHNLFYVGRFHLRQVCRYDETGTARVYVYYVDDPDSDDKYAVGPDSLMAFVVLNGGGFIKARATNTDQIESGQKTIDPRKLPAAPDAFNEEPQFSYAAPQLPRYDNEAEPFVLGKYTMHGYLRRLPDGGWAVLYYVAANRTSEFRREWVVGPAWLGLFSDKVVLYGNLAHLGYPIFEPGAMPPEYVARSVRYIQGVMHGDPERAREGLKAWGAAVKDPFWWLQVGMGYAGAAQPEPTVGTPSLKVLPGGGQGGVAVSNVTAKPIVTPPGTLRGTVGPSGAAGAAAAKALPITRTVPTPATTPRPGPQGVPGWNPNPAHVAPSVTPPSPILAGAGISVLSKLGGAPGPGVQPVPAVAAGVSAATAKRRNPGAYPIFWPAVFGPPMLFNTPIVLFVRTPNRERDWDYSVQLRRELWARHRGTDPDLLPSDFHAHHIVPLFLGGLEGARGNITFLPGLSHLRGHGLLADQPQMAFPPPPLLPLPRNIYQHPVHTQYELVGFK